MVISQFGMFEPDCQPRWVHWVNMPHMPTALKDCQRQLAPLQTPALFVFWSPFDGLCGAWCSVPSLCHPGLGFATGGSGLLPCRVVSFLVARSSVSCSSSLPDPCCTSFLVLLQCFSLAVLLLVEGTAALVSLLHASPALVQYPGTGPQPFLSPTSTEEQLTQYFPCLFKTKHKPDPPLSN